MSQPTQSGGPNSILCLIVNFFFPGLAHVLWLNQKKKGIAFLVWAFATILLCLIPVIGGVAFMIIHFVFTVVAMVDGYYISEKMNQGQTVGEGEFAPSVAFVIPLCQPIMKPVQGN